MVALKVVKKVVQSEPPSVERRADEKVVRMAANSAEETAAYWAD